MKRIFLLLIALFALNAQAQPVNMPVEISREYEVIVGSGDYSVSYVEDYYQNGPIKQLAGQLVTVPSQIENAINGILAGIAAEKDVIFMSGSLQGNPLIQIAPKSDGTALMTLAGVSYKASIKKQFKIFGVVVSSCTSRLSVENISIIAQYGSVDGQISDDSVGFSGQPSVDTSCSGILSWIVPSIENVFDMALLNGIKSAMNTVKDKLLLVPDQNLLRGLNVLIPQGKTIQLPNGDVFPIGQYVHDNVAYLASKSTLTIEIGRGLTSAPQWAGYGTTVNTGDVLYLALDSPVISFDVLLTEKSTTEWSDECAAQIPGYEDYVYTCL